MLRTMLRARISGLADANPNLTGGVTSPPKMRPVHGDCNDTAMTVS
jgi:hypothetical protein